MLALLLVVVWAPALAVDPSRKPVSSLSRTGSLPKVCSRTWSLPRPDTGRSPAGLHSCALAMQEMKGRITTPATALGSARRLYLNFQ